MTVSLTVIVISAVVFLSATLVGGNSPKLGLDLQGGASVVLAPAPGQTVKPGALNEAVQIIRRRVNGLGVSEANVVKQGNNVVVELPGVKDQDAALRLVGATAQLEFRPVLASAAFSGTYDPGTGAIVNPAPTAPSSTTVPGSTTSTTAPAASTTTAPAASTTTAPAASSTTKGALGGPSSPRVAIANLAAMQTAASPSSVPPTASTSAPSTSVPAKPTSPTTSVPASSSGPKLTPKSQVDPTKPAILPELKQGTNQIVSVYSLDVAAMGGDVVADATSELAQTVGAGWDVKVTFNGSGSGRFDALAKKYYQKQVAIVLDGVVVSAPTINAKAFNGVAIISGGNTGGFSHRQANDLALVLRYGSLPLKLDQQTVQKVSATLGKDSLRAGLFAGIVGLILVLLYMLAYYRALGLVVVLGLSVSGALMYSIVTYLGRTSFGLALSLSGVTGIVVAVGVTVDSYIVYFERLKDEIRAGRSVRSSVDRGFSRAWRTIVSADAVSFIGAFLLWWLSVGQVRGFAFFLGLSTLLDLLVAYTFTRPMVVLLGRSRTFTQARGIGVARGLAVAPAGGGS